MTLTVQKQPCRHPAVQVLEEILLKSLPQTEQTLQYSFHTPPSLSCEKHTAYTFQPEDVRYDSE